MGLTERSIYLIIILFMVTLVGLQYWWFNLHYDFIMEKFNIVWAHCK